MKTKITEIKVSHPAIRAMQSIGIEYLEQLCNFKEDELLALHGFGQIYFLMKNKGYDTLKRGVFFHALIGSSV